MKIRFRGCDVTYEELVREGIQSKSYHTKIIMRIPNTLRCEKKPMIRRVEIHSKIPSTDLVRIPLLMAYIISLLIIVSVLGKS